MQRALAVTYKIILYVFFSSTILLTACSDKDKKSSSGFFSQCENTFVVSGSRKVYLFEHHPKSVQFDQLAVFDDWAPISPFLDCANNRIVLPYGARKDDRNNAGVAIIDLTSGTKMEYPIDAKGIQGIPIKYNNGLLLSTTLLKQTNLSEKPPLYGYLPPGELYKDAYGENFRLFAPTAHFDLSHLAFTKDLDLDIGYSVIQDETLYASQRGAITAVDLQAKTTDILYQSTATDSSRTDNIPLNHLGVFLGGEYYVVLSRFSQNNPNEQLNGYSHNAIYQLVNGKMRMLSHYPEGDAVYLLGLSNKLFLFTNSLKVIEYDLKTRTIIELNLLNSYSMEGYRIQSVGYSHHNFILALDHHRDDISSKVLLISRDFTQVSSAVAVDLRLISITTDLAIDTADSRGLQLPVNQSVTLQ